MYWCAEVRRSDKIRFFSHRAGPLCFCAPHLLIRPTTILAALILPLLSFAAIAQTSRTLHTPPSLNRGLVVESVADGLEAETAGLKSGDVLLGWKTRLGSGRLESPFDMPSLWYEQASRVRVTLEGTRNGRKKAWVLGGDSWGISVRPNFTAPLFSVYQRAQALTLAGKLSEAHNFFRAAANTEQRSVSWLSVWFLSHQGELLGGQKAWPLVDGAYRHAVEESGDLRPEVRAEIFRQWSDQFASRDDFENAKKYRQEALHEWLKLGRETVAVADTLLSISEIQLRQRDYDGAAADLSQSMIIGDKIAPTGIQAVVTSANSAVLYQDRGELDKAETYYLKALYKAQQRFPRSSVLVQTLSNLGVLFDQKGDLIKAEAYHRRALRIATQNSPRSLSVADVLSNLAECVLQAGDLGRADQFHKQALLIREKMAPEGLSSAYDLAGLGRIARLRGRLVRAEDYYRRALATAQKINAPDRDRASFLIGLAAVFRTRRDFSSAEHSYREALDIFTRADPGSIDRADTLAELAGTLYEDHQVESAIQIFREALDRAEDQASHLGGMEEDRPIYRAQHVRYYQEYMNILVEQGQLQHAFELLESSRARTLLEMLSRSHVNIEQGAPPALLKRARELRTRLNQRADARVRQINNQALADRDANSDDNLEALLVEYQQIQAQIWESSPAFAALAHPAALGLKAIQSLLDDDTVLLEYSLGDKKSYVWLVTNHSLAVYPLRKRAEIEHAARNVYRLLTLPNHEEDNSASYGQALAEKAYILQAGRLSKLVLDPVAPLLHQKRVVIVSDGALQYIPFSALPTAGEGAGALPLILEHEIVNLPSASILAELRRQAAGRTKAPKAVAILADPVFGPTDERLNTGSAHLPVSRQARQLVRSAHAIGLTRNGKPYLSRLPYTRSEANAIMAVTPRGKGMAAVDFEANRRTAMSSQLANYRIVHLATHGLLDNKHPELSGLVLSLVDQNGRPQDGFLKLQDIYNMRLPVDLVVLSGCETGLGEQIDGEGLLGMTRGFMYAGATRVVASLWSVSDIATADLMKHFYRALEGDGMAPAAALRTAQIQMWKQKQWSSPYYWAGFEIQGEWQ
jgi:CHAT domain-containing protein/Tfp pilus assembly protein PilF